MRHPVKRIVVMLLSMAMALEITSLALASSALGNKLRAKTTTVASGVTVTNQSLWSTDRSDLRTENYIEYTPGGSVSAVVSYGGYVTEKKTMAAMAADLEAQGLRVVGGINAGFFNTASGTPIGLVITDGLLQSANPNYHAIGFKKDGTAVMGEPVIEITASWTTRERIEMDDLTGVETVSPVENKTITLSGFNKIRADGGYYLYSDTFGPTTKNNVAGVDVVLRPLEVTDPESGILAIPAGLPISGRVECQVVSVRDSVADNTIPADCFIISMNVNSDPDKLAYLSDLQPGDHVSLHTQVEDEEWTEVVHAVSGLYSLVKGGQVADGLSASVNPYTAVGLREDGSVVLYTVDGRQKGHSIGATYGQVAQRLIELGCVTAIAMDGGGSTSLGTTYADFESFQMINRGSDGSGRAVSTCLFLVSGERATGELDHFYVSATNDVVLMGSSTPLTATAVDTAYHPMKWEGELKWGSMLGQVTMDGTGALVYTTGEESGLDSIYVSSDGKSGEAEILVVDSLSTLRIKDEVEGSIVSSITLEPGDVVGLSAEGLYRNLPVSCADSDFTWTVEGTVGTVDETGYFAAGSHNATGSIRVEGGGLTVSIPVTVAGGNPFVDTEGHWAKEYVTQLYQMGITTGESNDDGTISFIPGRSITRGELLTLVVRMLKEDTAAYEATELPFADLDAIQDWLLPYVKAAYGLGLLKGDQEGDLLYAKTGDNVTREAAMVIIGRTLDQPQKADLSVFLDADQVSGWAQEQVQTLVALGVINGSDGMLFPQNGILRGEVAKIITMTIFLPKVDGEEGAIQPGTSGEENDSVETVPGEGDNSVEIIPNEGEPVDPEQKEVIDVPLT